MPALRRLAGFPLALTLVALLPRLVQGEVTESSASEPRLSLPTQASTRVAQAPANPSPRDLLPQLPPDLVGKEAPDFQIALKNGENRALSSLRGQVVVLNFWATWCPPCVEELPSLERLRRQLKGYPVEIVGVSVDEAWDPVTRLLLDRPASFTLGLDPQKKAATLYGTNKFPETYIIDPAGKVTRKLIGSQIWDRGDVVAYLKQLSGGKKP